MLVYGGYKKSKALLFNFLSGLTAVLGGVLGFLFAEQAESAALFLLPIAAGGFIYIAASDLIPEIKKSSKKQTITWNFIIFLVGMGLMLLMKLLPFGH